MEQELLDLPVLQQQRLVFLPEVAAAVPTVQQETAHLPVAYAAVALELVPGRLPHRHRHTKLPAAMVALVVCGLSGALDGHIRLMRKMCSISGSFYKL